MRTTFDGNELGLSSALWPHATPGEGLLSVVGGLVTNNKAPHGMATGGAFEHAATQEDSIDNVAREQAYKSPSRPECPVSDLCMSKGQDTSVIRSNGRHPLDVP